jgi:hypothetical protein
MVDSTAMELNQDLAGADLTEAGPATDALTASDQRALVALRGGLERGGFDAARRLHDDLDERVEALEIKFARRERVFQRLIDLLGHRE